MLSANHRAIVSATVPLLETGGEALTRHFYLALFRDYPEVVPFFNQANQQGGAQQRALANGLLAYAKNIDRLEALGPLVATIINKHVTLQIQPQHYPAVGAALLGAIVEVLGSEVATPAVIEAWGAAYGQLADILMGAEQQIYQTQAGAPGGWSGKRAFVVRSKVAESEEISSFTFAPVDGGTVMAHAPGQYIGLRATVDGIELRRQYSLSAASNGSTYRISVKREAHGKVSAYLHDALQVGDVIDLLPPAGAFVLADSRKPLVLISGGVGITPTLSMVEAALADGREVHFIHAARHSAVHAFRDHIDALALAHPALKRFYCYDTHGMTATQHATQSPSPPQSPPQTPPQPQPHPDAVGRLTTSLLQQWMPASRDVDAYLLGPTPFMQSVKRSLRELGVPETQTHIEFFGPAEALQ